MSGPRWFPRLRACLKLHVVSHQSGLLPITPFGRAQMKTGASPLDDQQPDHYMLYWIALPIFEWSDELDWHTNTRGWRQRWLYWHGRDGFRLLWRPTDRIEELKP